MARAAAASNPGGEYRIEELAAAAGITVRTLQAYRNKGLLPPARRSGRVVLFDGTHLRRLSVIADLLRRGYSLNAIGELFDGAGRDERIADLVGLEAGVVPPAAAMTVTPREVERQVPGGVEGLQVAQDIGILRPEASEPGVGPADRPLAVELPGVLRAAARLAESGVPVEAILAEGLAMRRDADLLAARLVRLAADHLFAEGRLTSRASASTSASTITEVALSLLPHAGAAMTEMVEAALRSAVRAFIDEQLSGLLGGEQTSSACPGKSPDPPRRAPA